MNKNKTFVLNNKFENMYEAYILLCWSHYERDDGRQTIRKGNVDELLNDRLYLYRDNEEECEKLMENEIIMLLETSFSNLVLEYIGWIYENVTKIFSEEKKFLI
ncbi:exported protein family 1,putative [Plasmodium sp.]|nr:exported protein family 1,putative [Plasmodium sp.]